MLIESAIVVTLWQTPYAGNIDQAEYMDYNPSVGVCELRRSLMQQYTSHAYLYCKSELWGDVKGRKHKLREVFVNILENKL